MRMHRDQIDVGPDVVAELIADQFPAWRDRPIRPVPSSGTVNALFRLGDEIVVRLPLVPDRSEAARADLEAEQAAARRLAGLVPVEVPEPLALGRPGSGYDGWWTAYRWLPGTTPNPGPAGRDERLANDLARVVGSLWSIDTGGRRWGGRGRGGPLHLRHGAVREALAASATLVDADRLVEIWDRTRSGAEPTEADDRWIHADLMPGNLLLDHRGRLSAVIDLGSAGIGDRAVDLMPAWNLFDPRARGRFRSALGVDDATWCRGQGWAIVQAAVALPYYVDTNPSMADTARRTLNAILDESPSG